MGHGVFQSYSYFFGSASYLLGWYNNPRIVIWVDLLKVVT